MTFRVWPRRLLGVKWGGAIMIGNGFWGYYTIIITRSPPDFVTADFTFAVAG